MNELVRLADGGTFVVRPMRADDADVVGAGVASLSPTTLRLRFFTPMPRLTAGVLADLTAIEPGQRIVLLAFEAGSGRLAGGARAVRHRANPATADIAVTIGDAFQRRGLGSTLLVALVRAARAEGIEQLAGHVLVENAGGRALVRSAGGHTAFDEPGVLRFAIPIARRAALVAA